MSMLRAVRAFAPATCANVNVGFDILGFALEAPGDEVLVKLMDGEAPTLRPRLSIDYVEGEGGRLPKDPARNTAGVALRALLDTYVRDRGEAPSLSIGLTKGLPLGSGMGSSAASSAAALVAANRLLGDPFAPEDLVAFAMEGERAACGAAHADNVAPAVMGGFVLIRSYVPLDLVSLPVPRTLHCALVHPDLNLPTATSRSVLPDSYARSDLVAQCGDAAAFVAALATGNLALLSRSMNDRIAEPYRASLIPGFREAKAGALGAGALGAGISGSGPSVFALADGQDAAGRAAEAMVAAFGAAGHRAESWVCSVANGGPRILEEQT